MTGIVFPRPYKWATDRKGQRYRAPVRKGERYQLPNGEWKVAANDSTWSWQLTIGSKARGDRRTITRGGYRLRRTNEKTGEIGAEQALAEAAAALGKGDKRPLMRRSNQTLGEHLDEWLAACQVRAKRPLKASTAAGYRTAIDAWIKPHVGKVLLADLDRDHLIGNSSRHLVGLYPILRTRGGRVTGAERTAAQGEDRKPVGAPLGSRSVQLCHTILHKALAAAVTSDKIPVSPIDRIPDDDRPTHTPKKLENRHWTPAEAAAFLIHTRDDRLHALDALALDSGARRGELAGLRWDLLDLDTGVMKVRRNRVLVDGEAIEDTPKSENSVRDITLHPNTVAALKAWRKTQIAERLAAGEAWGVPDGITSPDGRESARAANAELGGHVLTDELGRPYCEELSARFEQIQDGFAARTLTFHGLRHTSATTALANGVPVHVVSARLGHSSVSITYDIYAHVIPGQDEDAATAIGDAIWSTPATGTEGRS